MKVIIDGRRVDLAKRQVLGSGGEAVVTRWQNRAVKIYHPDRQTPERQNKLRAAISLGGQLPEEIIWPLSLVTSESGAIIGFTMSLVDPAAEPIDLLGKSRQYRQQANISNRDVLHLFLRAQQTLAGLHQHGIVVGDLSGRNELFLSQHLYWIDTDSYQFASFPCRVGTIDYIDPRLYRLNLDRGVHFTADTDWYSFAVILFRSLLLVHPFHGRHPTVRTPEKRAEAHLDILSPGVVYPANAFRPEILSDQLLDAFLDYFRRGQRHPFPDDLLQSSLHELVECRQCHLWYSGSRPACPECHQQNLLVMKRQQARPDGIHVAELFETPGLITACQTSGTGIRCLVREKNTNSLYHLSPPHQPRRQPLPAWSSTARYALGENFLVVAPRPPRPEIEIYDLSGTAPRLCQTAATDCFAQKVPIIGASGSFTYRLAQGQLLRGEKTMGVFTEKVIARFAEDQTWFQVNPQTPPAGDLVVGFWRVFHQLHWFLIDRQTTHPLALPDLESGESLLETQITFDPQHALVWRRTKQAGREYIRLEQVDRQGQILLTRRLPLSENPHYQSLSGKALAGNWLLQSSDAGLVRENLSTRLETTFSATGPYLQDDDSLWLYQKGVLVVSRQNLRWLRLA